MEIWRQSWAVVRAAWVQLFTDDPVNWLKWAAALAVLILGYAAALPLYGKAMRLLSWEHKRDLARSRGNMVPAQRTEYWRSRDDRREWVYSARYTYQRDGRTRTYTAHFRQLPPTRLQLYWLRSPRRLFAPQEIQWENYKALVLAPLVAGPWLAAALTLWLLGVPGL